MTNYVKKANFMELEWIPGEGTHLVQGIKNNKRPKRAYSGGNGSFIVGGEPAKLILAVETSEGDRISKNIYYDVKDLTDERITKKFRENLEKELKKAKYIIECGEISNIGDILYDILV